MNSYSISFENFVACAFVVNYQDCFEKRFISHETLNKFENWLHNKEDISIRISREKYFLRDLFDEYGNYFHKERDGISLQDGIVVDDLISQFVGYLPVEVIESLWNEDSALTVTISTSTQAESSQVDKNVGARIVALRKSKGMSQRDVARLLEVDFSTVCKWEKGERSLNAEKIVDLCILFGVTADKLIVIHC